MSAKEIEDKLNNKKAFQVEFGQKGTDLTYQEKYSVIPGSFIFSIFSFS
jgi:penicillin-binding protein 1